MSPFERVLARAEALSVLGVSHHADGEEIRAAWRKLAFESHPDKNGGKAADFERIRAAYEFLQTGTLPVKEPEAPAASEVRPKRPDIPRPKLTKRVEDLEQDVVAECRAALKKREGQEMPAANSEAEPAENTKDGRKLTSKDHLPVSISRLGRSLTFLVSNPLKKGVNRIALPTNVLETNRDTEPRVLSFFSHDEGPGVILVPDAVAQQVFPGARRVQIRFVGGQIERPITSLQAS